MMPGSAPDDDNTSPSSIQVHALHRESSGAAAMSPGSTATSFESIVRAACELVPFESLSNVVPGEGLCAATQELPVSLARDGATSDMRSALADLKVEFSLPLLTLEIIRDFWQILSLVISFAFTAPFEVNIFFGNFSFILSLDFFLIVPVDLSVSLQAAYRAVWWLMFAGAIVLTIYMEFVVGSVKLHPRREFGMFRTWSNVSKWTSRKIRALNFILTLLYLPLSQMSLELLFCSHRYRDRFGECPTVPYYICAGIMLLVMTIFLPIRLSLLIRANAPKQRAFDSLGQLQRVRSDAEYKADIASISRTNPMASLFCEYRRPMRFHKVTVMLLKFYLIAVAVCLSGNQATGFKINPKDGHVLAETPSAALNHVRPALLIFGLIVYMIVCLLRRPFLASLANTLDITLRVLAVCAVVCAWFIMFDTGKDAFTVILIIVLSLTLLASLVFFVASFDLVQEKFRMWAGDVVIAETSQDDPSPQWFNPDRIDFVRERKLRVWHHFWNMVLLHTDPFRYRESAHRAGLSSTDAVFVDDNGSEVGVKDNGVTAFEYVDSDDTVAYLLDFKGSVAERHHENVEIARDIGDDGFRLSLRAMTEAQSVASITAIRALHGLDVWWGDSLVEDGDTQATKLNSGRGGFGALFLLPVPVEGFWFPDEEGAELRLSAASIANLAAVNAEPEIRRRRQVRQLIRALAAASAAGCDVEFPYAVESVIQAKGMNGEVTNIVVNANYSKGRLRIAQRYDTPVFTLPDPRTSRRPPLDTAAPDQCMMMTPGFIVTFEYESGSYSEHGGGTAPKLTLDAAALGIFSSFQITPDLQTLLNGNASIIATYLPQVLRNADSFRRYFMSEFLAKSMTVSYSFWPSVVNNDRLPMDQLQALIRAERNPLLQRLGTAEHEGLLRTLYARIAYFNSCPAVAIWVCFWHDVYYQNLDMSFIAETEDVNLLLNPWTPRGLSWNVMSQARLTTLLVDAGLQKEDGGGFVPAKIIEQLYSSMAKSMEGFTPAGHAAVMLDSGTNPEDTTAAGDKLFELERHELYGPSIAPFVENTGMTHPLIARGALPDTNDFYAAEKSLGADRSSGVFALSSGESTSSFLRFHDYQRYLIVAERFGGAMPPDVYDPTLAV